MELLHTLMDLVMNMPAHLNGWAQDYGLWIYLILFLVIFAETGLVVTPILPGDSLLFALGAISATPDSVIDVRILFVLLLAAAIIGDNVNYFIGNKLGRRLIQKHNIRFIKPEYLQRTEEFFVKYGGKTIIVARFAPIVRTYAPFVAGLSAMHWPRFLTFSVVGGVLWMGIFLSAGYFFGNIPAIQKQFHWAILAIILISLAPIALDFLRSRKKAKA